METVELDQKKALLVDFAEGRPIGSTLSNIESNTSETVSILRSIQKGGLLQSSSVESPSPSLRPAESAQIIIPAPVVIEKATIKDTKPDKIRDKKIIEKAAKPVIQSIATGQKPGQKPGQGVSQVISETIQKVEPEKPEKQSIAGEKFIQKANQVASEKPEPAKPKENLTEARKTKGFIKGIEESIIDSSKEQRGENEKRDSLLAKAFSDKDDAKEIGLLGVLGPIAPAIQESLELVKGKDKDDDESGFRKLFFKSKKKEAKTAEENLKKVSEQGDRDEKGRFIAKAKPDYSKIAGAGVPFMQPKTEAESPEVIEKFEVIHDDLISGDKDQKKRDKKLRRAVKQIETDGDDELSLKNIIKNPSLLLKGGLAAAAVAAVSGGVTMIGKDIYDIFKSFTEKDREGRAKGWENVKAEDIGGVAGGVAGAIAGGKAGAMLGAFAGPFGVAIGAALGAGVGAIFGNVLGEKIAEIRDLILSPKTKEKARIQQEKEFQKREREFEAMVKQEEARQNKESSGAKYPSRHIPKSNIAVGLPEDKAFDAMIRQEERKNKGISVTEDKTSKRATDDNQNKKIQKQLDVSNEKIVTETKKTNKLLEEMIKTQKETNQPIIKDRIPDGIGNLSDQLAIRGL